MKPAEAVHGHLATLREVLLPAVPLVLLAVGGLVLAYWWLDPSPPKHVVLATGPARSAYDTFGQRYRAALARYGIDVTLRPTQGSLENLQLLREGRADVAFVQGGIGTPQPGDAQELVTLGSLFVEPLWLFYREDVYPDEVERTPGLRQLSSLPQLQGLAVNVGNAGSGLPVLMQKLFEANRMDAATLQITRLEETPATAALLDGQLDALVFASAPEALMVQMLLATPGIRLMDFGESEAYSRRFPFLTPVVLPQGVVDLASGQPPADVRLVATTTELLAREDTHPALQELFAQAAVDIHGDAGWFHRAGAFPAIQRSGYPVSQEAERTYRTGQPFLQRWMPFWIANLVGRMWVVAGLVLALVLPFTRIVPPLYRFHVRSRVFRWYGRLRQLERTLQEQPGRAPEVLRELDALDERVDRIAVPLSYADELYDLRNNIDAVRRRARMAIAHESSQALPMA
ncbi:ABC transporter substrate-binding protein [Ramlibacter ginsenosidimutans]|uniref:ABC transporter substrate-binding protein n=1 Tax=Ramlibacter ginsenosidimutans TaxID=502333 RepID=A0A934WN31_9BURK|nr:TAXI family TRAP transporter solute-binding subunit [Ramlibacter ginsenosidimutans]MBK6007220.1 ABC transporter substrate-binding protein [Ramlibacter ginsenosidimutans]